MDVNGSRFHLLQGARDWMPMLRRQCEIYDESGCPLQWDDAFPGISLAPLQFRFPQRRRETPPSVADRRGAACDRFGNLFWLGDDQRSIHWSPDGGANEGIYWEAERLTQANQGEVDSADFTRCKPPSVSTPPELRGLMITTHHYLVVGTLKPAGLLIFDLHTGGPPNWMQWPREVPFAPFDMASASDGGVWILDIGPSDGESRYWRLDRYFRVIPVAGDESIELVPARQSDFKPVGGVEQDYPAQLFPVGHALGFASPVEVDNPIAIVGLPDDSILILETGIESTASIVHHYRDSVKLDEISLDIEPSSGLEPPFVRGHDFAFIAGERDYPSAVEGELFVVSASGNQTFAFDLTTVNRKLSFRLQLRYLPMRRYDGKDMIVNGAEILYHLPDHWVALIEQPRPRFKKTGLLELEKFDGKEPGTVWHRLALDACISSGDILTVESRAAEACDELENLPWSQEPELYLRANGSELPYHRPFSEAQLRRPGTGTWELLLQRATGRYLQLRLLFRGSGHSTPRLRALRVWYPRFSYLEQYLPTVYRDSADSANFLERFLANVEGLFTTLEGAVADAQRLFDSRTAPPEYLDWLAGWFGVTLDPDWDAQRRRLFIEHAELLFRWRGTIAGLVALIRLSIEPCPDASIFDDLRNPLNSSLRRYGGRTVRIVEHFQTRRSPGVTLGDSRCLEQPRLLPRDAPYEPSQGPEPIHRKFQDFLVNKYREGENRVEEIWDQPIDSIRFPPILPTDEKHASDWRMFVARDLGFTYAVATKADESFFQAFLRHRYRRIDALKAAWGITGDSSIKTFQQIELPDELPQNRVHLRDWIGFVSLTLPIERHAHRFTVLVPTAPAETAELREQRLAQVTAVVERERPAHTEFEVQLFWALFQVGGARLGLYTVLGEGSRYVAMVLGKTALAAGHLDSPRLWDVYDRKRRVIGRDPLTENEQ